MRRRVLSLLCGALLLLGLAACGEEKEEDSGVSYPATSDIQHMVEMVARDYGPDVWVADAALVEGALECSFSSAQYSDGLLWLNFSRRGVDLESWIAQYGLSLEGPTHAWLWQPEDEEIYREDVSGIVYSVDIGASLEPVDAFPQDKLAWEEDPDLIPRPALHAYALDLDHPVTGEHLSLTAPIPADMARLAPELLTETECASEEI